MLDPDTISSYFGDAQVKIADLLLVLIYTAFMSSFGVMVGLLIIAKAV